MALKPDRVCIDYALDYFLDEVQERGVVLTLKTGGSGVANDDVNQMATAVTASGSVPLGVLLNDMVEVNLSRFHLNHHRDERPKGSKVTILKKGQVTSNMIIGNPSAGAPAYVGASGYFTSSGSASALVGRFDTSKKDGFAKISVNLP